MIALGLTFVIAVVGLGTLVWLWHAERGGARLFVLAAMPFALLFLAAGTGASAWILIQGFRGIAQAGTGGLRSVAAFCADSTRALLIGVVACALGVIVAAILQWLASEPEEAPTTRIDGSQESGARWTWVLAGWPLLALPAAALVFRARTTPPIVVKLAQSMGDGHTPIPADALTEAAALLGTEATVGAMSAALSSELVLLSLVSISLHLGLLVAGIVGVVAFTGMSRPRWMVAWSWVALPVVIAGAAALAITLAADLRWIEQAGR